MLSDEGLILLYEDVLTERKSIGELGGAITLALTELQQRRRAGAARGAGPSAVYVLASHFDCDDVKGVYATLDAAKQAAADDAEQSLTWQPYNQGEASHLIPPFHEWHSNVVACEGESLSYTIHKCYVRDPAGAARGGVMLTTAELRTLYGIAFGHDPADRWDEETEALRTKLRGLVGE